MKHVLRRTLTHDWPMLILVLLNFAAIALYLGVGPTELTTGGYRVIDIKAVNRLMDAGELSSHEAQWYHRSGPLENNNK